MPSLVATLGLNIGAFKTAANDASVHAQHVGKEISSSFGEAISSKLGAFATAGGLVVGIEEIGRRSIEAGERIENLSRRLGISTEAAQAWDNALLLSNSSLDSAVGFFEKLAMARKKADEGSSKEIDSFRKLGVSIEDLKSKRIEDIAAQIASAFESGDAQALIADLRNIGGRGAGEMVTAFKSGLAEMVSGDKGEIRIVDDKDIALLKEAGDELKIIGANFKSIGMSFTAYMVQGVKDLNHDLSQVVNVVVGGIMGFAGKIADNAKKLASGKSLSMKEGMIGPWQAMIEGAKGTAETFDARKAAEEAAAKAKRDEAHKVGPLGEGEESATKKEIADRKRESEHLAKLEEELAKKREANALLGLTAEQKLAELIRRRDELVKSEEDALDPAEWTKIATQVEDLNKDIFEAQKKAEPTAKFKSPEVNALQRIGAYSAVGETTIVGHLAKSEAHLQQIKNHLEHLDKTANQTKF